MTIGDIGSLSELVGAIATVGTLIYVALQIRENTSWSKRQALESGIDRIISWQARLTENPEIMDVYLNGKEGYESFDEASRYRLNFIMIEILATLEALIEHGKTEAVKREALENSKNWIRRELEGSGTRIWWNEMGRERLSADYAGLIDDILSEDAT
jgi:hypothetical protein